MTRSARRAVIGAAGILIMLIAGAALLLPLGEPRPATVAIGWMLLAAGLAESVAAAVRHDHRRCALAAAIATVLAGLRLLLDPAAGFFEVLNLVILWLVVRAAALGFAAFGRDRFATWTALAASVDFLLAVALLAGLPIAFLVVGLFGPTRPINATFAWVLAISFLANGVYLLATAKDANGKLDSARKA